MTPSFMAVRRLAWRPTSSETELVWVWEKRGSPVTMKSVAIQSSGAPATSTAIQKRRAQLIVGNR